MARFEEDGELGIEDLANLPCHESITAYKINTTVSFTNTQSFILALYISAFDWRKGDVVHMINMYGFFSTLAFTTNAFLALRVMYYDREWMKVNGRCL